MSEFDLTLPKPSAKTLQRCNELLLVFCFKRLVDRILPEYREVFLTTNAKVFDVTEKQINSVFKLIKDDITAFGMKELCVATYYLSGNGLKESYILKLFDVKLSKYRQTLKMYMAFDRGESLEPKLTQETVKALNGLVEKLTPFADDVTTTYKKIKYLYKEN